MLSVMDRIEQRIGRRRGVSIAVTGAAQVSRKRADYNRLRVTRAQEQIGVPPMRPSDELPPTLIPTRGAPTPYGPTILPPQDPTMYTLTPGTFPAPSGPGPSGYYTNRMDLGPLTNSACNFISDARLRALCVAAGTIWTGTTTKPQPQFPTLTPSCPEGYRPSANGGCQLEGVAPYLPGDIGRQDFAWQSVNGRYGAGYVPLEVGRMVRRCPPGSKLGNDGVCYDSIARTRRMHNPGAKPFLTGGEVNVLRRAKALNRRKSKLLGLFPRQPKPCRPRRKR